MPSRMRMSLHVEGTRGQLGGSSRRPCYICPGAPDGPGYKWEFVDVGTNIFFRKRSETHFSFSTSLSYLVIDVSSGFAKAGKHDGVPSCGSKGAAEIKDDKKGCEFFWFGDNVDTQG